MNKKFEMQDNLKFQRLASDLIKLRKSTITVECGHSHHISMIFTGRNGWCEKGPFLWNQLS